MSIYLTPDKVEVWNGVMVKKYFLTEHNEFNILLPKNHLISVDAVTIHNTDWINVNKDTTPSEQYTRATKNGNMNGVIVHFYVDDKCAWWNMPLDMETWHSGDGIIGKTGNNTSISIEVIMDDKNTTYNQKAMENAAKLAAYLLNKFNLSVEKGLVTHTYWLNKMKDISGNKDSLCSVPPPSGYNKKTGQWEWYKTCPYYIINGKGWNYFERITTGYYNNLKTKPTSEIYRIRKSWSDSASQIGAYKNLDTAKEIADFNRGYKVFNNSGLEIYSPNQYYEKYVTTADKVAYKKIPEYEAKLLGWLKKDTTIIGFVGSEHTAKNGTIWIKAKYKNNEVYVPLKYLKKVER